MIYEIIDRPEGLTFSHNLKDIVLQRNPTFLGKLTLSVFSGDITLCAGIELTFNSEGLITIKTSQIAQGLERLHHPTNMGVSTFSRLQFEIDAEGYVSYIDVDFMHGIVPDGTAITDKWWNENFLTWQPQEVSMPRWQPQWLSIVNPTTNATMPIHSKVYTAEGIQHTIKIADIPAEARLDMNVSFDELWSGWLSGKDITPIAYDVYGQDNQPYAQRYTLRENRYSDRCFIFQNTLGGLDSIVANGETTLAPDGDITTFINDNIEGVVSNTYTSIWEQTTGYISSERIARQWKEFFGAKYCYLYIAESTEWMPIIVEDYTIKEVKGSINSYTFKYHLAKRNEGAIFSREQLPEPNLPTQYF